MLKQKKILLFLIIVLLVISYNINSNLFGIFSVKPVKAGTNLSCSLNPFILEPGNDITINAVVDFDALNVWTVITNSGVTLTTQNLTSIDDIHYTKIISTTSFYSGKDNVAVYATDSDSGITYTCNPSDGSRWEMQSISDIPWHARTWNRTLEYQGKMWVMGGHGNDLLNDVWSSVDGLDWQEVTENAGWSPRAEFGAVVFDNKMWVMGGIESDTTPGTYKMANDVWSSTDGVNWTRTTASADWSGNSSFGLVVYDNKMWVIAGCNGVQSNAISCNSTTSEVWYSSDGISWTRSTAAAAFGIRALPGAVVFDDGSGSKMWIYGGSNLTPTWFKDVWYSTDGETWTRKTDNAAFGYRSNYGLAVYNNKMWLFGGGYQNNWYNDSWYSSDGSIWTQASDPSDFPTAGAQPSKWTAWTARRNPQVVVHNAGAGDQIWVMGGRENNFVYRNDVWHSSDGIEWNLEGVNYGAEFGYRWGTDLATFGSKMYLVGGLEKSPGQLPQDVWSTEDGVHWTCLAGPYTTATHGIECEHSSPSWDGRWGHKTLVYDNKIWIIGGCKAQSGFAGSCPLADRLADVWYSSNGYTWTQATATAAFGARYEPAVTVFDGKMWLMGGYLYSSSQNKNDVYSSTDGATWTLETGSSAWSGREALGVTVFNNGSGNKMYLMGGWDGVDRNNDVWSSADGINWTSETSSALWDGRYTFGLAVYDNKMFVFGGNEAVSGHMFSNDIYYSSNGSDWSLVSNNTDFDARDFFGYTVFKNRMYLAAGDGNGSTLNDVVGSAIGLYFVVTSNPTGQIIITGEVEPTLTLTLSSTSCDLGTFDAAKIKTCNYNTQVSTNGSAGYVANIKSDGQLRSSGNNIADVSGSTISAANEGYGISTTEPESVTVTKINDANSDGLFNQSDCTIMNDNTISANASVLTTSDKTFAKSTEPVAFDTVYLCHEAAISSLTPAGSYSQLVTLTVVSNY
jgi:hypothetical protein